MNSLSKFRIEIISLYDLVFYKHFLTGLRLRFRWYYTQIHTFKFCDRLCRCIRNLYDLLAMNASHEWSIRMFKSNSRCFWSSGCKCIEETKTLTVKCNTFMFDKQQVQDKCIIPWMNIDHDRGSNQCFALLPFKT